MANFARKTSKREAPDKNDFTCHNHYRIDHLGIPDSWNDRKYVTCISIDPGIANLCIRVERRKLYGIIDRVDTLYHGNESFTRCKTDEKDISILYAEMTKHVLQLKRIFEDVDIVLIERQLKENYKSVRVSQHILTLFQTFLWDSDRSPLILEIDAKVKSKLLAPKNVHQKYVKDWSVEKALQLCFLRRDWKSFSNILYAKGDKRDDLADVIVQLEAMFTYLSLSTTLIPLGWDILPVYSGWQPGMIFFRKLGQLIGEPKIAVNLAGWIKILQLQFDNIKKCGNTHIVDEDGNLKYVQRFKFRKSTTPTNDTQSSEPEDPVSSTRGKKFSFRRQ